MIIGAHLRNLRMTFYSARLRRWTQMTTGKLRVNGQILSARPVSRHEEPRLLQPRRGRPLSTRADEAMERLARDQRDFGALHWRSGTPSTMLPRFGGAADRRRAGRDRDPEEHVGRAVVRRGGVSVASGRQRRHDRSRVPVELDAVEKLDRRGVELRVVRSHDGAFTVDEIEPLHRRPDPYRHRLVRRVPQRLRRRSRCDRRLSARSVNFSSASTPSSPSACCRSTCGTSNIAFLAADGHKWMCGSEGAAIFFVARGASRQARCPGERLDEHRPQGEASSTARSTSCPTRAASRPAR